MSHLFLVPLLLIAAEEERSIRPGETLKGSLRTSDPPLEGRGPSKRFGLRATADGPLTISLESHDFDAFLAVETSAGKKAAEDQDGGVETNARVVLRARKGTRYRIVAASAKEGGAGEFTLSVTAGDVPRPEGAALSEAGAAFSKKAAERAVARGDRRAAAGHRLEEGERLADLSRFAEAKGVFETCLALARTAKDRKMEAQALASLGYIHRYLGDLAASREVQEKALAILVELGERNLEARVRGNLGQLLGILGDFPGARIQLEKSLEIARDLRDRGLECNSLKDLGTLFLAMGDTAQAMEHFEKGLALAREIEDRRLEGSLHGALGNACSALRDFPRAREHYEKALAIDREMGDRFGEASVLGNLGLTCYYTGDYARAREYFERSLALARETGSRSVERNALFNLANVDSSLGDHRKALERYANLLEAGRGDRELEATAKVNMGAVRLSLGEYALAIGVLEEALAIHRELGNRNGELFALINLGKARGEVGDEEGARSVYEKALALAREQGDRLGEATILGNLGVIADMAGDVVKCRKLYEKRLALCREIGDRAGEAIALGNLGAIYSEIGEDEKSLACHKDSLAIAREIGDRTQEARALGNMALGLILTDRPKARELAEASHAIYLELGEKGALWPLRALALIALEERDPVQAQGHLREATSILERASSAGLEIADAAGLRSEHDSWELIAHDLTALRRDLAGADGKKLAAAISEGFREASRWKGRALLEGIAEHHSGGRTAEAIRIRRERKDTLARRQSILEKTSRAILEGKPAGEIEALRAEARALLAKADDLARRLRKASPRDAELDAPSGATPDAVRKAAVGDDTLLIEYAPGVERLHAYVLGAKGLDFIDLGERKAIETGIEAFRSLIITWGALGTPAAVAEAGRKLHDVLLAPALERAGKDVKRLVIVPTASLAALPFEALVSGVKADGKPKDFGGIEFVLDRYTVSYAPSSAVLVEVARSGARKDRGKTLVLADPLYPSETKGAPGPALASLRGTPAPKAFRRIAKTRNEALAIARLLLGKEEVGDLARLSKERSASLSSDRLELHLGAEASRERLAAELKGYGVIHLAAHGYVDLEHPQRTGIALAFGEGGGGYFTLAEVLDLDLDAELVVLSACETAGGAVKRGEGVESLARAFLYAGARGVIASLWQVSDRAAADTMRGFYQRAIAGKLSPAEALREAKLALRRAKGAAAKGERAAVPPKAAPGAKTPSRAADPGHPFYWAPFIHVGLPR